MISNHNTQKGKTLVEAQKQRDLEQKVYDNSCNCSRDAHLLFFLS